MVTLPHVLGVIGLFVLLVAAIYLAWKRLP